MKKLILLAVAVVLALSIVSCNNQSADPAVSPAERYNLAAGYDMEGDKGSWVLVTDHFRLRLPPDLAQYELQVDQPAYETLEFSWWHPTSDVRGESVPLFTLTAYELRDEEYRGLEDWVEVGQDRQHRYVVSYAAADGEQDAERLHEFRTFFDGMRSGAGHTDLIEITA